MEGLGSELRFWGQAFRLQGSGFGFIGNNNKSSIRGLCVLGFAGFGGLGVSDSGFRVFRGSRNFGLGLSFGCKFRLGVQVMGLGLRVGGFGRRSLGGSVL